MFQHRTETRQWKWGCDTNGLWVSASRPLASEDIRELDDGGWGGGRGGRGVLIAANSLFHLEPGPN